MRGPGPEKQAGISYHWLLQPVVFVSDDGRDTLGTSFFMQLDDRAAAGDITMIAGGDKDLFELHKPALAAMGGEIFHAGDLGKASVIKVITNMLAFIHLVADAEALMLAKRGGLDLAQAWNAICTTPKPVARALTRCSGRHVSLPLRRLVLPSTATTVPGSSAGISPDTHRRKLDSTARASSMPKTRPMVSCEAMPCSSFTNRLNQSSRSSAQA